MKRWISLLLALCILAMLAPVALMEEPEAPVEEIEFALGEEIAATDEAEATVDDGEALAVEEADAEGIEAAPMEIADMALLEPGEEENEEEVYHGGFWEDYFRLDVGESLDLYEYFDQPDSGDVTVAFTSEDPSVATVDKDGMLTGVASGVIGLKAVWTCDGGEFDQDLEARVFDETDLKDFYLVNIDDAHLQKPGFTLQLEWEFEPETARDYYRVEWKSNDESVATIDQNGMLKIVGGGIADLTVSLGRDDQGFDDLYDRSGYSFKALSDDTSEGIVDPYEQFPDEVMAEYVSYRFDLNEDGMLSANEIAKAKKIELDGRQWGITSLEGIQALTALETLTLRRFDEELDALDLSQNTALKYLRVWDAYGLTELDLSHNAALKRLELINEPLEKVTLSDKVAFERLEWDCAAPLPDLKQWANTLQSLEISPSSQVDLSALKNLTTLDYWPAGEDVAVNVSANTKLTEISGYFPKGIDLSKNTKLESFYSEDGSVFGALDFSKNTALKEVEVYGCQAVSIDLSKCAALQTCILEDIEGLTSVKLASHPKLDRLEVWCDTVKELDISGSPLLLARYKAGKLKELSKGIKVITESSVPTNPTSVVISGAKTAKLTAKTAQLTVAVAPTKYLGDIKWSAKPTSVATVDQTGKVTFKKGGEVAITAKASKGGKSDTFTLTIEDDTLPTGLEIVRPSAVSADGIFDMVKGKTLTLEAKLLPEGKAESAITWKVDDAKVASVSNKGVLKLKKPGSVTVTATAKRNAQAVGTLTLKVVDSSLPESVHILDENGVEQKAMKVLLSKKTLTLKAVIYPDTVPEANAKVTWKSSKSGVATMKNGVLTLKKDGETVITVTTAKEKKTATLTLTVVDDTIPTGIEIASDQIAITGNAGTVDKSEHPSLQLRADLLEKGKASSTVTWKSLDTKVATVSNKGLVKFKTVGQARITATAKRGNNITTTVTLTVTDKTIPTGITLSGLSAMKVKDKQTLTASFAPNTVTEANKGLKWTTSDSKVATVSSKGVVTAKKAGPVTITATSKKNGEAVGTFKITVS